MKLFKILMAVLLFTVFQSFDASAQSYVTRTAKDSVATETKYIYFHNVKKGTTGIAFTGLKKSGTVAAVVTLERRLDTVPTLATAVWKQMGSQSYTVTDTASPQGDIFPITIQDGQSYRLKVVGSGGVHYVWGAAIRF